MRFKNDLEMWHRMGEFARHLNVVAGHSENKLIRRCKYYEYDSGAAEEICRCPSTKWEGGFPTGKLTTDFHSSDECYKCEFREVYIREIGSSEPRMLLVKGEQRYDWKRFKCKDCLFWVDDKCWLNDAFTEDETASACVYFEPRDVKHFIA